MKAPLFPVDEEYRLEALRSLKLLDTAPEIEFDNLVRLGKRLFDAEICLVSLVDSDRQWFKACVGLDAKQTPRAISFCGHAILGDEVFVVNDALHDERFSDNPLVIGPPNVRFYAGMPLRIPTGYNLGTLCVISSKPRPQFNHEDKSLLADLANAVVGAIAIRAMREDGDKLRSAYEKYATLAQITTAPMAIISSSGKIETCNSAFSLYGDVDTIEGLQLENVLEISQDWMSQVASSNELEVRFRKALDKTAKLYPYADGYILAG